jgi:predicted GTPase
MGMPGCGKSTLINLILNEKRAREGIGYSITKLYSQYLHKKYPITLTDTPGFEDDKARKKMEEFLNNFSIFFKEGKFKFHLVLYLINASNERIFMRVEFQLIDTILKSLKIPIFFVCTRSRTEEASFNFKEEVKINLIQKYGFQTKLIEHIYCCLLLNEKDGGYKRFGIDKLLRGIKDYFSKEIKKIEEIESDFENFLNIINFKTYEQYNLSILSSLENSNSFTNYL